MTRKGLTAVTGALIATAAMPHGERIPRPRRRHTLRSWINGVEALDYVEQDPSIGPSGVIGIQVHGDGKTIVQVKDLVLGRLDLGDSRAL